MSVKNSFLEFEVDPDDPHAPGVPAGRGRNRSFTDSAFECAPSRRSGPEAETDSGPSTQDGSECTATVSEDASGRAARLDTDYDQLDQQGAHGAQTQVAVGRTERLDTDYDLLDQARIHAARAQVPAQTPPQRPPGQMTSPYAGPMQQPIVWVPVAAPGGMMVNPGTLIRPEAWLGPAPPSVPPSPGCAPAPSEGALLDVKAAAQTSVAQLVGKAQRSKAGGGTPTAGARGGDRGAGSPALEPKPKAKAGPKSQAQALAMFVRGEALAMPPALPDAALSASTPSASPKGGEADAPSGIMIPEEERTTLMLRNLPSTYSRTMLLEMLDSESFRGRYDFVYLPTDFRSLVGFGYAFVNMVSHADAARARAGLQGFDRWAVPSEKVCEAVWSDPHQGFDAHVERYRNSPVMHDQVPDEYKPAVFENGVRSVFPAPTKRIRPPRLRRPSEAIRSPVSGMAQQGGDGG